MPEEKRKSDFSGIFIAHISVYKKRNNWGMDIKKGATPCSNLC